MQPKEPINAREMSEQHQQIYVISVSSKDDVYREK